MPYADPEKALACKLKWQREHQAEINEKQRARYAESPEVRAKDQAYYEANKARILEKAKANYRAKRAEKLKKAAEYREAHRGEINQYFRERGAEIAADPVKRAERNAKRLPAFRKWQAKNRKKLSDVALARYHKDIDKSREKQRRLYARDPELSRAKMTTWRKANIEKVRAAGRANAKRRREEDLNFRIRVLLTNRVNDALRNNWKSARTMELIGASVDIVRAHIEAQFEPGMSWDNWAQFGWHVDHDRPVSAFDLTNPDQQKAAFHYTNLKPRWWRDNLIKNDKIDGVSVRVTKNRTKILLATAPVT